MDRPDPVSEHVRESPAHRQLRLLHLQPRPGPALVLGARTCVRAQRHARPSRGAARSTPTHLVHLARSRARRARPACSMEHDPRARQARFPCSASASGHQSHRRGVTAATWCARGAAHARQDLDGRCTTRGLFTRHCRSRSTAGRYHSLIAAPDALPADLEVSARSDGRRRSWVCATARCCRRRRAVSSRERAHARSAQHLLENFLATRGARDDTQETLERCSLAGASERGRRRARSVHALTDEHAPRALAAAVLVALRAKGEQGQELRGFRAGPARARARACASTLRVPSTSSGTGGDGSGQSQSVDRAIRN